MVSDIELALAAGCNAHISKPFERTIFYDTIAYHLEHSKEVLPSNSGTMSSSDGELAALTRDFTTGLAGRLAELEDTIKSSDWNALRACAHKLKGSAGMYGFMELSKLAAELELGAKEGAMDWINRYYKDIKEEIVKLNKPCASDF
jgi:HPt (histidine-containing phosphotransfer) domain-containing protein